jgi:hypothetical protein
MAADGQVLVESSRWRQPLPTLIQVYCHREVILAATKDYTPSLRRAIPARASNPVLRSEAVQGSGMVDGGGVGPPRNSPPSTTPLPSRASKFLGIWTLG